MNRIYENGKIEIEKESSEERQFYDMDFLEGIVYEADQLEQENLALKTQLAKQKLDDNVENTRRLEEITEIYKQELITQAQDFNAEITTLKRKISNLKKKVCK